MVYMFLYKKIPKKGEISIFSFFLVFYIYTNCYKFINCCKKYLNYVT